MWSNDCGLPHCLQVSEVGEVDVKVKKRTSKDEYQTGKFLILLLVLQLSMFMVCTLFYF